MDKNIQDIICQAHMAGQKLAGWPHPSWSEALAYFNTIEDVQNRVYKSQGVRLKNGDIVHCDIRDDVGKVF